jgi:dTDP-4-dehydrorhamnose reductase
MLLILGSSGQLGKCISSHLDSIDIRYMALNHHELDIANGLVVDRALEQIRPSVIVNTAAWTNVDGAEENETSAFSVNCQGALNVALAARACAARLIHVSTDYVFDGEATHPYVVDSPTNPMNAYGRSKLAGEQEVLRVGKGAFTVVRTAWLYSEHGSNFAKTMTKKALMQEPVRVVADQFGQPTNAHDLAQLIISVTDVKEIPSIIHGTNSGATTWYEFAREIYGNLGADKSLVSPVSTMEFPSKAVRPKYSVLSNLENAKFGLPEMQNWSTSLGGLIDVIKLRVVEEGTN